MMFEAFGFTQERTLHCRKSSQLPSEGLLWQCPSAFLILHTLVFLSSWNSRANSLPSDMSFAIKFGVSMEAVVYVVL